VKFFFDADVIIVTSSVNRTQCIYVLSSPPVVYHNSQVSTSIVAKETNKLNK